MRSLYFVLLCCVGVTMAFGLGQQDAHASERGISAVLGDVEWGDDKDEVLKKLRAQMLARIAEDRELRQDRMRMQNARRDALEDHKAIEESYTKLEGARTGFEVSVIAGEFTVNNGESMLRVRDEVAQRFFFFIDGKLYKMLVAYNPNYIANVGFEAFVAQASARYGRPTATDYGTLHGEDALLMGQWQDAEALLRIENKKEFFATYTMTFVHRDTMQRFAKSGREFGGSGTKSEQGLSKEVQALTETTVNDANAGIIDNLVGDVQIDLSKGRPTYDEPEVEPEPEPSKAVAAKPESKKKKKKKKKKKTSRDFSDVKTGGGGDDLIIY